MKIDNILLDKLSAQTTESPGLRMKLDLRNSWRPEDAECDRAGVGGADS